MNLSNNNSNNYHCKLEKDKINDTLLCVFFNHHLKIKMFHFQTHYYGRHKSSDVYLEQFQLNYDKFMEVYQGIYDKVSTNHINIKFNIVDDNTIFDELDTFADILKGFDKLLSNNNDLLNIRDEMLAEANQFKYLLKFK